MKKRLIGIDFLKIIACVMVVSLHTFGLVVIKDFNKSVFYNNLLSQIAYYSSTVAIPLFFMINGFLILKKEKVTYSYIFIKIRNIMGVVIFWGLIVFLLKVIVNKKTFIITEVFSGVIQRGIFSHFWFLGSLMMLLLLAPIFHYLLNNVYRLYLIVVSICFLIAMTVDFSSHINQAAIQTTIIQTFRVWTWLFYYLIGGLIYKEKNRLKVLNKSRVEIIAIISFLLMIVYSIYNKKIINTPYAEYNYDNIIIMTSVISIFILFSNRETVFSTPVESLINILLPVTMGIYIIHPIVIRGVQKIIIPENSLEGLLIFIFTFFISTFVSRLIKKNRYSDKIFLE